MIEKIAHISDVHIRKNPSRNDEYYQVFNNLFESLRNQKPDRICLTGDIVDNYINMQGEQLVLLSYFFNELSKIATVITIRGNHDYESKNKGRVDTIDATLTAINNPNIKYFNETNFYEDENVVWCVWKHGDKKISPWSLKSKKYDKSNTTIDLFHNTVNGSTNNHGYKFESSNNISVKDLKGDYSFLGHIHKQQYLDKKKSKAYAGSLISQAFDEGDDNFHGYIMWNIVDGTSELIGVHNDYSFKNIEVNNFTDFNDLDIEISNETKHMKVRVIWNTSPFTKNSDNESKIESYLRDKYQSITTISHKEDFLEDEKIDNVDKDILLNINNIDVQHNIFKDYFDKLGVDDDIIDEILKLDETISSRINTEEFTNNQWDIVKFGGKNFMSYENFDIDWNDTTGIYQITGGNTYGKTTLFKAILYTLYNKTPETKDRIKNGDSRYVNNRNNAKFTETYLVFQSDGEYYGVKRRTDIKYAKDGSINNTPTTVSYYKLNNPNDELSDENSLENLNEEKRTKTQKIIDKIIGSYDNFLRVVFTTSDTLNIVLSNDMADFLDSLLYDSGFDIFDRKLTEFKAYSKEYNSNVPKISCNVESNLQHIEKYKNDIIDIENNIKICNGEVEKLKKSIENGNNYIKEHQSKLYEIDNDLYNTDIESVKNNIINQNIKLSDLNKSIEVEKNKLIGLAENFDEVELNNQNSILEKHRNNEYNLKYEITQIKSEISKIEYMIQTKNGEIFKLTNEGKQKKEKYLEMKNAPKCTKCGQSIVGDEHKDVLEEILSELVKDMYEISDNIKLINLAVETHNKEIEDFKIKIEECESKIKNNTLEIDSTLHKIGQLTNDRNDVIKRNEINGILERLPLQIEIVNNNIKHSNDIIDSYNNNLKMIDSNKKVKVIIDNAIELLNKYNDDLLKNSVKISEYNNEIKIIRGRIDEYTSNIEKFKIQQRRELVEDYYAKCIHRNGLPKQMLSNYIIPKINDELDSFLNDMPFRVWLDETDLRPKLTYKNNSNSTIDAISSSGKERTFASLSLKMALIAINKKSKPRLILLDEVTGKLVDESVDEFIELLYNIKRKVNRIVIVEHTNDIEPNYILNVSRDNNGISSVEMLNK